MLYDNIEQGVRCEELQETLRDLQPKIRNWEGQVLRLQENINTESRLLADLNRQADRTGDYDSFAPEIRRIEETIQNLQRQIEVAEANAMELRNEIGRIEGEMSLYGCNDLR